MKPKAKRVRKPKNLEIDRNLYCSYIRDNFVDLPFQVGVSCLNIREAKKLNKWLTQAIAYLEQEKVK